MKWVNQRKTDVEYYLVCGFVYKIWIKENTILNTKNGDMMTIQTASETSGRNRKIEETFVQHDKRKNKRIKLGKCFKDDTSTPQWNWLKLVPASSGLFYFDTTAPRKNSFTRLRFKRRAQIHDQRNCFLYLRCPTETKRMYIETGGLSIRRNCFLRDEK